MELVFVDDCNNQFIRQDEKCFLLTHSNVVYQLRDNSFSDDEGEPHPYADEVLELIEFQQNLVGKAS